MKNKKKTIAGVLVMLALVLLALPLGVNRSLSSVRKAAEDQYYYDSTGYAIFQGLAARQESAHNLITVAKKYTDQNQNLTALIDELESAVTLAENSYEFEEEVETNRRLTEAAHALSDELSRTELSERDAKYPESLILEMDSQQDKIERSSYNAEARKFNEKLEKFPVSILRGVAFVSPLALFN